MAAKGRQAPRHLRTGAELGNPPNVAELVLMCSCCFAVQTETFDEDVSIRTALAGATCTWCGRAGTLRLWKAAS